MNSLPSMTPQPGGLLARIKALLGAFFNLFPLGGSNGGVIIRQKGGTPGANEVQISVSGSTITVTAPTGSGGVTFTYPDSSSFNITGGGNGSKFKINTAGNLYHEFNGASLRIASDASLKWSSSSGNADGSLDTALSRVAAAVLRIAAPDGTSPGWLQNTAGRSRLTADVTNVTTTLANLVFDNNKTLIAGRFYSGLILLTIDEALATDGFQLDLNGGTATMTNLRFGFVAALGATLGTRTSTALGTAITLTALTDTSDVAVLIFVSGTCNAAGTLIPRQAKNSDGGLGGGTLTTRSNSFFWLEDMPG